MTAAPGGSAIAPALVEHLVVEMRRRGYRVTGARRRLIEVLAREGRWLTPQELHAHAHRARLRVGLATVYRVLELLLGLGFAQAIADASGAVRFVLCPPGHHDHLVCRACGRVVDVIPCCVQPPTDTGFRIEGHVLTLFGRCPGCAPKECEA